MNMNDAELIEKHQQVVVAIRVLAMVLNQRFLTFVALCLMAGMFGWAMYAGGWDRLAISAVFGLGAWCLVKLKPKETEQ